MPPNPQTRGAILRVSMSSTITCDLSRDSGLQFYSRRQRNFETEESNTRQTSPSATGKVRWNDSTRADHLSFANCIALVAAFVS